MRQEIRRLDLCVRKHGIQPLLCDRFALRIDVFGQAREDRFRIISVLCWTDLAPHSSQKQVFSLVPRTWAESGGRTFERQSRRVHTARSTLGEPHAGSSVRSRWIFGGCTSKDRRWPSALIAATSGLTHDHHARRRHASRGLREGERAALRRERDKLRGQLCHRRVSPMPRRAGRAASSLAPVSCRRARPCADRPGSYDAACSGAAASRGRAQGCAALGSRGH